MTNTEFIRQHLSEDVRQLALRPVPDGVDIKWCLQQIEGWQLARQKLPHWASAEDLWFPPRLSMEQCSSEETATYKRQIVERLLPLPRERHSMIDLTGGYGVDFSYLSTAFQKATYVERQQCLCDIARHNFPILQLNNATIVCAETQMLSSFLETQYDLIYIDPSRRDDTGRKTVAIESCTPDISQLQHKLLSQARHVLVKLSPMLDITQALRSLDHVSEIHVVSVHGECKELLLVLSAETREQTFYCVNLCTSDPVFSCTRQNLPVPVSYTDIPLQYLYEPNASILKANIQDSLSTQFSIQKLHPMSHLFTSNILYKDFPGRIFKIEEWSRFSKYKSGELLKGIYQANISIRNFPGTVAMLRKRLNLKEGGDTYLFATTLADGTHTLLRCIKA